MGVFSLDIPFYRTRRALCTTQRNPPAQASLERGTRPKRLLQVDSLTRATRRMLPRLQESSRLELRPSNFSKSDCFSLRPLSVGLEFETACLALHA
jgi:hypothetical protein